MRRGASHQKKLCSGSIFVHPRAAIFGTNSVVEYANIFQLHCLCKSSTQLFFVSDNSGLAWIWKELCSPRRRRHHCLEKYIKWSIFFWIQSQQTYLHDSEVLYEELLHELYQFAWKADLLSFDVSVTGEQIGEKLNNLCQKKWKKLTAVSGCQSSLGEETSEKFFRKSSSDRRTILQIFLPFKTTTFCCFEEKTFSFLASYTSFLFRDNPLNSGTIYGTLYCLPHLPTFPRKSKNHSVFLLLKLFQQY